MEMEWIQRGREVGKMGRAVEAERPIIGIYCMSKQSIFKKRKKIIKKSAHLKNS